MCLVITPRWEENLADFKRSADSDGYVYGYKILKKWGNVCSSYHMARYWLKVKNRSSRRLTCLSEEEEYELEVQDGFHFYMSPKNAYIDCLQLIKCQVHVDDLVAVNGSQFVATRCEWILSFVEVPGTKISALINNP